MKIETYWLGHIALDGGEIASHAPGPDGALYVLVRMKQRTPCDWRVLVFHPDGWCAEHLISNQQTDFTHVQPLPEGLLLATNRCYYGEDLNGHIFDTSGKPVRRLSLGDGIAEIQTTPAGEIWVSFFDQGVIGSGSGQPIGRPGLLRFNADGEIVFKFRPAEAGLDMIVDCYCLNVLSEKEVWCYYHSQFPIVQIFNDQIRRYWSSPIHYSHSMAIWRDTILMQAGPRLETWTLLTLGNPPALIEHDSLSFCTPEGVLLTPRAAAVRHDTVWFVVGSAVYAFRLRDLS